MQFQRPLIHGTLIKRYKRFLADITLDNGNIVVAHTTNSGSMKSCLEPGAEVYLSEANDPNRKTQFTWEMIKINDCWIGINTTVANILAFEAVKNKLIKQLAGFTLVKREVKFGDSRYDIYCENNHEKCFIEVKNVSYKVGEYALFPDAVTTRGQKHLKTLIEAKQQGYRAVMLYVVQRTDVCKFAPAIDIDPQYAFSLSVAVKAGVEVIAIKANVTPQSINLMDEVEVVLVH